MFPCLKTVPIEACSPYQNNASPAKPAAKPVQFPARGPFFIHATEPVEFHDTMLRKTSVR
jgi:hypothetical protein